MRRQELNSGKRQIAASSVNSFLNEFAHYLVSFLNEALQESAVCFAKTHLVRHLNPFSSSVPVHPNFREQLAKASSSSQPSNHASRLSIQGFASRPSACACSPARRNGLSTILRPAHRSMRPRLRSACLSRSAIAVLGACPSNSRFFCWRGKRESDSVLSHEQDIPRLED